MTLLRGFEPLFHRHSSNPILSAADWPYPVHTVFNAGATRLHDGTTLLLCRVEDRRGHSHLCAARSANGVDGWVIDREPTLWPDVESYPEELWGIEDPRITFVEELGKYAIAYTAYSKGGPGVALALTEDFRSFERYGLIMQPDDKDAALLPRRVDGSFALLHRPMTDMGAHIWISYSPDLRNWGGHKMVLPARRGAWWDANKVGLSPPLIETRRGWLMLYHGVRQTAAGCLYRLGVALLDLERPEHCLIRGDAWIFGPEAPYERDGDVGNVTFPCGYTLGADGDTINLYYGAADTSVALASGSIRELLRWLDEHRQSAELRLVIDIGVRLLTVLVLASSCTKNRAEEGASIPHSASAAQSQHQTDPQLQTLVIPSGTAIVASLDERLTTEMNVAGDQFTATTLHPIVIGGRLVVPAGSCIHGIVRNVQTSGRVEGRAEMTLAFQDIVDVEGKRTAISALPLTLQADSERCDAGIGDTVGGRLDTDTGAGVGAVVILATHGGHIELDSGRKLNIQMSGPAKLTLAAEE